MEKKMMGWGLVVVGVVILAVSESAGAQITCGQAITDLLPCQDYLVATGPAQPSIGCCLGVETVWKAATSTQIRRDLCECLKKAAAQLGVKTEKAKLIPQYCKVSLPVPLDPKIDCSTIPIP